MNKQLPRDATASQRFANEILRKPLESEMLLGTPPWDGRRRGPEAVTSRHGGGRGLRPPAVVGSRTVYRGLQKVYGGLRKVYGGLWKLYGPQIE